MKIKSLERAITLDRKIKNLKADIKKADIGTPITVGIVNLGSFLNVSDNTREIIKGLIENDLACQLTLAESELENL